MSEIPTTNPTQDLFFYALHGDVPGILSCLESGADPNAVLPDIGSSAVTLALSESLPWESRKQMWVVGFNKLSPEYRQARTPLLLATEFDQYDAVLTLLERGADPNFADEHGITPLWAASQRRKSNIVRLLLRAGASVEATGYKGQTPLFRAVEMGDLEIVRLLLVAGANADRVTPLSTTPLLLAARRGQRLIVQSDPDALMLRGRLLSDQVETKYNEFEENKKRVMSVPPAADYPAIVAELLAHGASARFAFPPDFLFHRGTTALHEAASIGCEETVRLLLEHGAELDFPDGLGRTPLTNAAYSGNIRLVQFFLDQGARVNGAGENSKMPLTSAASTGSVEIVRLLLDAGASSTTGEESAIHHAAESNHEDVVRLLIERGADRDAQDSDLKTPLMVAVKSGAVQAVRALIEAGADLRPKDQNGDTAWGLAQVPSLAKRVYDKRNSSQNDPVKLMEAILSWKEKKGDDTRTTQQILERMQTTDLADRMKQRQNAEDQLWAQRALEAEAKRTEIIELLRTAGAE